MILSEQHLDDFDDEVSDFHDLRIYFDDFSRNWLCWTNFIKQN